MRPQTFGRLFSIGLALAVPAFFVANVPLEAKLWPVSIIAILLFSAPVFYGAVKWLGWRRGIGICALLGVYALIFETVAIKTGWPYGNFIYGAVLGPQLFGSTPVSVLVAWTPLVLGALALFKNTRPLTMVVATTIFLVLADLVLDPAAVYLGFWAWPQPGWYYGVPWINFFGWIISGGLAATALVLARRILPLSSLPPILLANFVAIIAFWTLVNGFAGQLLPAVLGTALTTFALRSLLRRPKDATL